MSSTSVSALEELVKGDIVDFPFVEKYNSFGDQITKQRGFVKSIIAGLFFRTCYNETTVNELAKTTFDALSQVPFNRREDLLVYRNLEEIFDKITEVELGYEESLSIEIQIRITHLFCFYCYNKEYEKIILNRLLPFSAFPVEQTEFKVLLFFSNLYPSGMDLL